MMNLVRPAFWGGFIFVGKFEKKYFTKRGEGGILNICHGNREGMMAGVGL